MSVSWATGLTRATSDNRKLSLVASTAAPIWHKRIISIFAHASGPSASSTAKKPEHWSDSQKKKTSQLTFDSPSQNHSTRTLLHVKQHITRRQHVTLSLLSFSVTTFRPLEERYDVLTLPFLTVKRRANRGARLGRSEDQKAIPSSQRSFEKRPILRIMWADTPYTWFSSGTFIHLFTPHFGLSVCVRDRTIFMPSMRTFPCTHSSPFDSSLLVSVHVIHTNLSDSVAGSEHHCTESTKWGW